MGSTVQVYGDPFICFSVCYYLFAQISMSVEMASVTTCVTTCQVPSGVAVTVDFGWIVTTSLANVGNHPAIISRQP